MYATPSTTALGYLVRRVSVSKCPAASAVSLMPCLAHSIDSTRVRFSTAARAADECAMPGRPWWGESVTFRILPAAAARDHGLRGHRVAHQPRALHVQPQDGAKALGGDVLGRGHVLAARVVHQQVHLAVPLERACHQRLHLVLLADVALHGLDPPVPGPADRLLQRLQAAPANDHGRAAAGQLERGSATESRSTPAHDRHLAVEQARREDPR